MSVDLLLLRNILYTFSSHLYLDLFPDVTYLPFDLLFASIPDNSLCNSFFKFTDAKSIKLLIINLDQLYYYSHLTIIKSTIIVCLSTTLVSVLIMNFCDYFKIFYFTISVPFNK